MSATGPILPQGRRFVKAIAWALRRRCGVRAGRRVLVACSGGADSVALLRAMAELAPSRPWRLELSVAHVQHHLRDPASEEDAGFVAALAQRLDLPLLRADLDLSDVQRDESKNLEARARRRRYEALAALAATVAADHVAVAHHADDQLETLLMRLLRGSSVRGLSGIAWRRRLAPGSPTRLIRPMLAANHAAAVEYLQGLGQPWREDATNADTSRWRARLRAGVLPVLRELRSDAAQRALHTGEHLRRVAVLLEQQVDLAADRVVLTDGGDELDRVVARSLPAVVLSGLLRKLLLRAGVPADALGRRTVEPIVRAVRDDRGGSRSFRVTPSVVLVVTRNTVQIVNPTLRRHEPRT